MPVVPSERSSPVGMSSAEEQGQRWLIVAYVLVLGLQLFAVAERLRVGQLATVVGWLPFIGLQLGMMCAAWLGHRWARWILFLLLLREALLSLQFVLNFSNTGMVVAFAIYSVALYLVGLGDVGNFVRHQHRRYKMSAEVSPGGLAEKAALWSLLCPAMSVVMMLSGQPPVRDGYDAGPLLGFFAILSLLTGIVFGIVGIFASSQRRLMGTLRGALAGTTLCGMIGGLWIWAAAGWPEQLERARMMAAQQTKHYLPIQTTVLQLEVVDRIKVELARILNKRPKDFDSHKPLVAQGANDLQIVELVLALERTFQVKVPDAQIAGKTADGSSTVTIEQLADAIAAEMKNKVSTAVYDGD